MRYCSFIGIFSLVFLTSCAKSFEDLYDLYSNKHQSYITNASYVIESWGRPGPETSAFYTFDGNLIVEITESLGSQERFRMLDPFAPNPRPAYFEIRRCRVRGSFRMPGAEIIAFFCYEIWFYDKNGHILARLPYEGRIPADRESLRKCQSPEYYVYRKYLDVEGDLEDRTCLWTHPLTWFKRFKMS